MNFESVLKQIYKKTNLTTYFIQYYPNISVPGVIPLILLDVGTVLAAVMCLTSNPRLTTILWIRDSGAKTRSSTTRSSQGGRSSKPPEQPQPEQAQATGQPSSQQEPTQQQQDPDSFPGSDEPDWQASFLGFDSRTQYRVVDRKVAGVQRQLRPVEGNQSCFFASLRRLMAVPVEYTNQHMRRKVVFHLATHVAEYEQDLIPLIRGIHGAGDPLTTLQSVCSCLQDLQQTTFWADEIVLRVLSIIYKFTITLAGPGGCHQHAPPQQDPFLLFSHTFLPKSVCIGGRCPPTGQHPRTGNPGSTTA